MPNREWFEHPTPYYLSLTSRVSAVLQGDCLNTTSSPTFTSLRFYATSTARQLPRTPLPAILEPRRTMHMLRYDDGDLSLTQFEENDIPEYAILSHTWEQDNNKEVAYAEVMSGTGQGKTGFEKIRFCGERAGKDGLSYFWLDTCCINKENKAELRRSINSKFRWYRNACRCYIYLSDVLTRKRKATDQSPEQTWELSFQKSRWFT
ncbi:hypothetical protein IFR04_016040 [Cadophora malorum]|uniref:Heterokaryon incompatibility domain-containing protein n=1 Tax=Cadophora malorum TaxID=108018 RepID=A0A8H7T0K6_9HELO|nr:hypothetical protein IFR04_016040 [Cadophora malorum]